MDLSKLSNEDLIKLKRNAISTFTNIREEQIRRENNIENNKRYNIILKTEFSSKVIFESNNINEVRAYYKKAKLIHSKWKYYYRDKFHNNKNRFIHLYVTTITWNKVF
jgi:hypothetical protein